MKNHINYRSISGRLGKIKTLLPPFDLETQHAILFMLRQALREELVLLDMIADKEKHINRVLKGNTDLTNLLQEWIINDLQTKKTK